MKKHCMINKTGDDFICTCFPDSMSELSEWYPNLYSESISLYSNLIDNILDFFSGGTTLMISNYALDEKPNLLSQKKGMKAIFSKYNKEYCGDLETCVEFNNSFSFISIAKISNINLDTFFVPQIQNIICSIRNLNLGTVMDLAKQNTWNTFIEKLREFSDAHITYCDVGCDGNSIKIHTTSPSVSLEDDVCIIARNLNFEIIKE